MAIIGFIILLLAGLYFAWCAIGGAILSLGFTGKFPWAYSGFTGFMAAVVLYVAFTNMPFSVTFS